MSGRRTSRGPQRGYILALNIAILALLMVGATYIGQRMSLAMRLAQAEKQHVADEAALEEARARVLYLLATVPRGSAGLGSSPDAVKLDGRYYRVGEGLLVALQDARGLLGINALGRSDAGRAPIERLLATYGLDAAATARLTDALLDYLDADNLTRINGAEAENYRAGGLEWAPRNADLLTPTEVARVFGWADQPELWGEDPITDHLHVQPERAFNAATTGWRALAAQSAAPPEIARDMADARRQGDIGNVPMPAGGTDFGIFGITGGTGTHPGETLIVTLRPAKGNWGWRMAVRNEPQGIRSPWRISYAYRVGLAALDATQTFPDLPEIAALRDAGAVEKLELPF